MTVEVLRNKLDELMNDLKKDRHMSTLDLVQRMEILLELQQQCISGAVELLATIKVTQLVEPSVQTQ